MKKVQHVLCLTAVATVLLIGSVGCSNQNPASTPGPTPTPTAAAYSLPDDITVEDIRARGGVIANYDRVENAAAMQAFLTSYYAKIPEEVLLVQFTAEGDPIFYQLNYNGDVITCFVDSRQDKFGQPEIKEVKATGIVKVETDYGTSYQLTGTGNDPYDLVTVAKESGE